MNEFNTLLGQKNITVTAVDGTTESVTIRSLPVKFFPELLGAFTDELKKASLYAGKPVGWVENLTPESHELVITEGDSLNADFFGRWLARRKAAELLLPKRDVGEILGLLEVMQKSNPQLLDKLMSQFLPAPPPVAAEVAPASAGGSSKPVSPAT